MLPIVINILQVIHVLVSLLIILIVLMQRPKNEGLGAAFGGGATDQLFGAQTTNVLQTITRWLGGAFFGLTLLLSVLYVRKSGGRSSLQEKLIAPTVIPATPATATPEPAPEAPPTLDGKELPKLELSTPEAASAPVQPPAPLPEVPKVPEPSTPAAPESKPAPAPEPAAPAAPDSKPVPAEPAK
jgi:preprotein translocase subunit SecG